MASPQAPTGAPAGASSAEETASRNVEWLTAPDLEKRPVADAPSPTDDVIAETIADVPVAQVSADELNSLTEPLIEEEPVLVRHSAKSKGQIWPLVFRMVGAIIVVAALVFLLRESDDPQYGPVWKTVGLVLAFVGFMIAVMPGLLRSRTNARKKRHPW